MNAPETIRILLIEDNPADAGLLEQSLIELPEFKHELHQVARLAEGIGISVQDPGDIVLLDLNLPDSEGIATFLDFHGRVPDLPVLVLTAFNDVALGMSAVQCGAQDFLVKNQISPGLLERAIRYAIERHRLHADLERSNDRLRRLANRLVELREDERTRISREVHDELGQQMTGLMMDLRWLEARLKPGIAPDQLVVMQDRVAQSIRLAGECIAAMQRIAFELRPSALDHLGLADAIREEARRFEARTSIRVTTDLADAPLGLQAEVATAMFRIFQELLTNVARHAQAQSVRVGLRRDERNLVMDVEDDGKGISDIACAGTASLGMLGMRERAEAHGGELRVARGTAGGTRATVLIPDQFKEESQPE